ncbi:hypothetical protein DFH09DRAFT_1313024 [Mycena vulgaris]|nr:hypothetical protein DFH09DRAFT_1331767 [Mycena vulgaris]KAJ6571014.1 hypothetical protein DFH09DRAFT_1313024 [Mycena vulgaris]
MSDSNDDWNGEDIMEISAGVAPQSTSKLGLTPSLRATTMLNVKEDVKLKFQLARAILSTRQAEASFILSLVEAAQAETELLKRRADEVKMREDFYSRLFEAARSQVVDAETHAGQLKEKGNDMGLNLTCAGGVYSSDNLLTF